MDTMDNDTRELLQHRRLNLKILISEVSTPLLQGHIRIVVTAHDEALKSPQKEPNLKHLDSLYQEVVDHWQDVYGDMNKRASLLRDMMMFQKFLIRNLQEDYLNHPFKMTNWILHQAEYIAEHKDASTNIGKEDEDTRFHKHIMYPLSHMMLDKEYVQKKLCAVASGESSQVWRLVRSHDWSALAQTIYQDRELALDLFRGQVSGLDLFSPKELRQVKDAIDAVQRSYFKDMSNPSTYSLTTRAEKLSRDPAADPAVTASKPRPQPEASSARSLISNICSTFRSNLGRTDSKARSGASATSDITGNENAPLVHSGQVDSTKSE